MLIVRRSKLCYTVSGIITPIGGCPVHRLREDLKKRMGCLLLGFLVCRFGVMVMLEPEASAVVK